MRKQFYSCEMKYDSRASQTSRENVEYDINTLIRDEAELILENDDTLTDVSDEKYGVLVDAKAKEIKDELMRNGIYKNKYGIPLFLYC
jgi:hypothetical protein